MGITVGGSPVTVSASGPAFATWNTASHAVKIVNASNGQDVSGGSVTVPMLWGTVGNFVYAGLPGSVTLNANTTYYIVSQETAAGEEWYDVISTIQTTRVASETTGVWNSDGATYNLSGSANQSYVPGDFKYSVRVSQPTITQQPQSRTASTGAAATFSVTATGGNLSYQWSSEGPGGSSFTPISGATGSSYTATGTTLGQSGTQYMGVVTNTAGTATFTAVTLTVVASSEHELRYVGYSRVVAEQLQRLGGDEHYGRRISGDGFGFGPDVCGWEHGQPPVKIVTLRTART